MGFSAAPTTGIGPTVLRIMPEPEAILALQWSSFVGVHAEDEGPRLYFGRAGMTRESHDDRLGGDALVVIDPTAAECIQCASIGEQLQDLRSGERDVYTSHHTLDAGKVMRDEGINGNAPERGCSQKGAYDR